MAFDLHGLTAQISEITSHITENSLLVFLIIAILLGMAYLGIKKKRGDL